MTVREHPKSTLTAWERWELPAFDRTPGGRHAEPPADTEAVAPRLPRTGCAPDARKICRRTCGGGATGPAEGLASGHADGDGPRRRARQAWHATGRRALEAFIAPELNEVLPPTLALRRKSPARLSRRLAAAWCAPRSSFATWCRDGRSSSCRPCIHPPQPRGCLAGAPACRRPAHPCRASHPRGASSRAVTSSSRREQHIDATLASRWRRVDRSSATPRPGSTPAKTPPA